MLSSGVAIRRSQHDRTQLPPDGSRKTLDHSPPPRDKWALTPESFDRLLLWLHHDRDEAGLKYEEIRARLIKRFRQLGCHEPEDLANETIDRVAGKLEEIIDTYKGDPEPYFFSVAYYVYKEYLRRPIMQSLATLDFRDPVTTSSDEMSEKELLDSCLRHCLGQLDKDSHDMILEYYRGDRQVKIQARKALAERLGIGLAILRLRAQRVRSALKKCILDCMERKAMEHHISM
jgi:DNA-directed RNA polymerase specialized sigma24 family protein